MSIFDTNVETLTPEGGKYIPSKGLHQAKVIALVDLGDQECEDQCAGDCGHHAGRQEEQSGPG